MNLCLLGVDFSNSNLGCQALGYSIIKIINDICVERGEHLHVTAVVFENTQAAITDENVDVSYICIRPKQPSFFKRYRKCLKNANLTIDFTGGDSFSDIYGTKRFLIMTLLKNIAIRSKTPFILGPQTIGPFSRKWVKRWAVRVLRKSDYVFVRDSISCNYTKEISGREPYLVTDVAFELPYNKNTANRSGDKKTIGINPSGLLWFEHKSFDSKNEVRVDYKEYLSKVIEALLKTDKYEIHLIPHVFSLDTTEYEENCEYENDMQACYHIHKLYPSVVIEKSITNPMEAKSVISNMDVFTGARMHATIAAISSGVPVIPFSYSRKFEGLFGSIGYNYIIRGTSISTEEAVSLTLQWIETSSELKANIIDSEDIVKERIDILKAKLITIMFGED